MIQIRFQLLFEFWIIPCPWQSKLNALEATLSYQNYLKSNPKFTKDRYYKLINTFQKAVDVNKDMIKTLMNMFKQRSIDYIMGPFEADAQCAALGRLLNVDAICSEDSDILPFLAATCFNGGGQTERKYFI